jgi:hypothetical protein
MKTILNVTIENYSEKPMSCWVVFDEMLAKLQGIANTLRPYETITEPDGEELGVGQLIVEDLPIRFSHADFDEPSTTGRLDFYTEPPLSPKFTKGELVRISFTAETASINMHPYLTEYRLWTVLGSRFDTAKNRHLYELDSHETTKASDGNPGEVAECDLISENQWNEYRCMAVDLGYAWSETHRRFTKRHLKATHYDLAAMWRNKIGNVETPF